MLSARMLQPRACLTAHNTGEQRGLHQPDELPDQTIADPEGDHCVAFGHRMSLVLQEQHGLPASASSGMKEVVMN